MLFSSAEANQHDNVRQAIVWTGGGGVRRANFNVSLFYKL